MNIFDRKNESVYEKLEWLKENACQVEISFSPNAINYQTVQDYIEQEKNRDVRDGILDAYDSVEGYKDWKHLVELHVYPRTPNTSMTYFGPNLRSIIDNAVQDTKDYLEEAGPL